MSPLRFCPPSDQKAQASAQKRCPANSVGPSAALPTRGVWLRSRPGWTSCFVASVATSTMKTRSLGFGHNAIMATTQCSWKCTLISFTISKICLFLRLEKFRTNIIQISGLHWQWIVKLNQWCSVVLLPVFGSFYYILQFDSALEMNGNDMVAE